MLNIGDFSIYYLKLHATQFPSTHGMKTKIFKNCFVY